MKRILELRALIGWPGLVTLLSICSSWTAIGFLLAGNVKLTVLFGAIAFQLDVLDGYLARRLNKTSDFGRQLDSLSDVINYSLLAALVTSQHLLPNLLGNVVGFLILAFGILRLALFNVKGFYAEGEVLYYRGIITCHLSLATLLIYVLERITPLADLPFRDYLIAGVLSVLAIGQLSQIKTRKSGVLIFWIPVSILIGLGALLWL